jgi:transposase
MPLSIDLRKRVIDAINGGMSKAKAARVFQVSRKAIYNWLNLFAKTNSLAAKTGYQKGHSHKITDWETFKAFVEANKHRTVNGMIVEWKKLTGIDLSDSTMENALKKINYSCKKKLFIM